MPNNIFIDKKALFVMIILIAVFSLIFSSCTPTIPANDEQTQNGITYRFFCVGVGEYINYGSEVDFGEAPPYDLIYQVLSKWKFGPKEEGHIKNLLSEGVDIDLYTDWFLKEKASKTSGLNIGLIANIPMIEEFKLFKGESIKKTKGKKRKSIEEQMIETLINEKNEGRGLSSDDNKFFEKFIKSGLIIKDKETKKFKIRRK